MKKIGVLVPQSKSYPQIGKDFVSGLRLNCSDEFQFIIDGIGLGENPDLICEKIDKLSLQDDVDVIVGLLGDHELTTVYEKVNALQIPSFFARMGAYPDVLVENNQYAFTLTYGLCDSLSFLGDWLVQNGFKNIGVSGSFNDAGYGFLSSLEKTLYTAGGAFTGHYTPPLNPRPDEASFLKGFYETVESDAVCQLYNGVFAQENVDYLEQIEGGIKTPLFFMPFALDESLLKRVNAIANDVFSVATWLPVELTGEPTPFDTNYFKEMDKYPTVPSMLGHQVQQALTEVLPKRKELLNGTEFEMSNNTISGRWNSDLRFTIPCKVWKCDVSGNAVKMIEYSSSNDEKEYNKPFDGQVKGWHNAYLCY